MKAIILAAGRGSRMGHLTDNTPKCLLEINGEQILDKQIKTLWKSKIYEIGFVTGYRRNKIKKLIPFRQLPFLVEFYNPRWHETNMVYSLVCAHDWLSSEPCIVSYSDIFYDPSAVKLLIDSKADIAITYDPNWRKLWERRFKDPLKEAESFILNCDGTIREIGKKPAIHGNIDGQYMGLLKFTPVGWEEFLCIWDNLEPPMKKTISMTEMLQKIIEENRIKVYGYPYRGTWGEIDTEKDLEMWNV